MFECCRSKCSGLNVCSAASVVLLQAWEVVQVLQVQTNLYFINVPLCQHCLRKISSLEEIMVTMKMPLPVMLHASC